MSYMRGQYYVWVGSDGTDDGEEIHINSEVMPMEVFDALVVMRMAELVQDKQWEPAVKKAINDYSGNFGSNALAELCGFDPMGEFHDYIERLRIAHLRACPHTFEEQCPTAPGFHQRVQHEP